MRPDRATQRLPRQGTPVRAPIITLNAGGFTLLEVIVAVAIMAASGTVILQWLLSAQDTLRRAQARQAEAQLTLEAQSLLRTINPLQRPEGRIEAGPMTLRWTSVGLTPVTDGVTATGYGPGAWKVALFRVDIEAVEARTGTRVRFSALRVGQRVREGAQVGGDRQP